MLIWVILFLPVFAFAKKKEILGGELPKREFRAVWVATVANIDWPSKPGLTMKEQKDEILALLDLHEANHMNAIIMQIRPVSDAFYPSALEPWSRYLTGKQGFAPAEFYDPLAFFIAETHRRGMEFHAWFNPYRVKQSLNDELAPEHIFNQHPDWGWTYGNRVYFDPGHPGVRDFVTRVVRDVVKRYDVDAIHFDDYFYPYKIKGKALPDSVTFAQFPRGFASNAIDDWRRDNVNLVIKQISQAIKSEKPWVKFGISPFGVWRNQADDPDGSATTAGTTNFDNLYADVILWQREGWIDYLLPQLYWQIGHPAVDFKTLTDWWSKHGYGRGVYIGHAVYKLDEKSKTEAWQSVGQLTEQIKVTRSVCGVTGSAWFSSKHFRKPLQGFADSLKSHWYGKPAMVPTMPWLDDEPPFAPVQLEIIRVKKGREIRWADHQDQKEPSRFYAIYRCGISDNIDVSQSVYLLKITGEKSFFIKRKFLRIFRRKYTYKMSALDRTSNESELSLPFIVKQ